MNVLLLTRYSRAGNSSRVRSFQYLPFLQREGIEVTQAPLSQDDFIADLYTGRSRNWRAIAASYLKRIRILLQSKHFDLLWIERELFPYVPALAEFVLATRGRRYIVDYDDAIFHTYDQHRHWIVRLLLGGKIDRVMRNASLVIVGNEYLAHRARQAGAEWVEQLPSVVDSDYLQPSKARSNTPFTIGWIGSPLNAHYLEPIQAVLAQVSTGGQAQVVLVGSGEVKMNDVPLTIRPWVEERESTDIGGFDVGIMPLLDRPWERGKCGYKLLQYFACGVPAVASPVGVNCTIVEDNVNGFLATSPDEWASALMTLRDNPQQRRSMGECGRSKVEREFSLKVAAPRLVKLLRQARNV